MNIQSPMIQLPPPNIPSEDGYVMFIGVVKMMAHKFSGLEKSASPTSGASENFHLASE